MKKLEISMGFLKPVQNFLKKYTALLPSIAIVIVALLLFFPTMMIGKGVKEKMKQSASKASEVTRLNSDVPSEDDPAQIKRYMDQLLDEASRIEALMVQTTQRELISYDVFPPRSTSSQLYTNFGQQYRTAIEGLVKGMNALDAPSESEIIAQTGGRVAGPASRGRRATTETDPMVDALCLTRAQAISVYAHPSLFAWYEFWANYQFEGESQALVDCWDSQIAYWIYQDVTDTIAKMNEGSQTVSSSPVKRLMGVSFSGPVVAAGDDRRGGAMMTRGRGTAAGRDRPNYMIPSAAAATSGRTTAGGPSMASNFVASSLTTRKSDEEVDIVHFAFSVLVDNHHVMAFMKELCSEKPHVFRVDYKADGAVVEYRHNQITLLQDEISVVDKQAPEHALYRYGKGAVMRLDLTCEYQFIRKGYDTIKPEPIKVQLGQSDAAPAQAAPGMGGMGDMMMF